MGGDLPGLAILITVLAINLIGDGLRDALDPKLKTLMALLEIRNLTVEFQTARGLFRRSTARPHRRGGRGAGIVGESGSGKSVAMLAVMGLLPWTGKVTADRLAFDGHDLLTLQRRRSAGGSSARTWR